jgi:hypothetical protein
MVETLRKPDPGSGLFRLQAAAGMWFARAKVAISSRALEMYKAHPRARGLPMFRISENGQEAVDTWPRICRLYRQFVRLALVRPLPSASDRCQVWEYLARPEPTPSVGMSVSDSAVNSALRLAA